MTVHKVDAVKVAADQERLIADLAHEGYAQDFAQNTLFSVYRGTVGGERAQLPINLGTAGLRLTETCTVTREMWEMAAEQTAAVTEPNTMPFDPEQLPIRDGVLHIPRTTLIDKHGEELHCDAIAWRSFSGADIQGTQSREGVFLFLYTNEEAGSSWDTAKFGEQPENWPSWTVFASTPIPAGSPLAVTPDTLDPEQHLSTTEQEALLGQGVFHLRWWVVMLLMSQSVAEAEKTTLPRAARRRLERLDLQPTITTIALRKTATHAGAGTGTGGGHLTMRHLVRGHWRTNPKTGAKDIFVRPHMKGPEDAPIRVSKKVNALIR